MTYEIPHPIEAMSFFQTSAKETAEMKAIYEEFVAGHPEKVAKLNRLIDWAGQQRSLDDSYNNADFS